MSCQADDLLNANHLILTNHSAYQLIFIIQAYLLCVLLYSSLNRASSLTLLARPLGPTLVITSNITRSISIGTPTVIILERVSVNTAFCKGCLLYTSYQLRLRKETVKEFRYLKELF